MTTQEQNNHSSAPTASTSSDLSNLTKAEIFATPPEQLTPAHIEALCAHLSAQYAGFAKQEAEAKAAGTRTKSTSPLKKLTSEEIRNIPLGDLS